jgi:arginyl-tRNA synthetase
MGVCLSVCNVMNKQKEKKRLSWQFNNAMTLYSSLRGVVGAPANPLELAHQIVTHLPASPLVSKSEVAAPGFVNCHLNDEWVASRINQLAHNGVVPPPSTEPYLLTHENTHTVTTSTTTNNSSNSNDSSSSSYHWRVNPRTSQLRRVCVDFSSPNIAKEMHVVRSH